jgi:PAS domain S-box-containing protein
MDSAYKDRKLSRSRFEGLADRLERAFLWQADAETLQITYVSPGIEAVLGIPSRHCLSIDFWATCSRSDDVGALKRVLEAVRAERSVRSCQHRCVAGDGREVWLHTIVWASADGAEGGRLEGVSREMAASTEALGSPTLVDFDVVATQSLRDGVMAVDHAGRITFVNEAAERLLGWTQEEVAQADVQEILKARPVSDVTPPAACTAPTAMALQSNSIVRDQECFFRKRCGEHFPVRCTAAPMRQSGVIVGAVLLFRDLSERQSGEDFAGSLYGQRGGRNRDELLAMLGHELRNPLAPVATAARMLRIGDEAVRERAGIIIERQVEKMGRLIDDLLDYADFAAEVIQLDLRRIDLRTVVDGAMEDAASAFGDGQYELGLRQSDEPLWVEADMKRIRQAAAHLLTAVVSCVPSPGRIDISTRRDGQTALLEVRDNGAGIPDDLLSRGSWSFSQPNSLRGHGRSVRLAVIGRILESHGGSVDVVPVEGEGTRFVLRLPLAPAAVESAEAASNVAAPAGLRPRILVVDDNVDLTQSLDMLLREYGYDVRTAYDGAAAIAAALEFLPEVVFLDIGLPDMDGYDVARRLRRHPSLRSATLVALTGYGRQVDRERSATAGFDHHLTKPVRFADLEGLLSSRRTVH